MTLDDHIKSFWQSTEFNQLRSELFIQALRMQEAWLAEALQKKYFGGNLFAISTLLDNKHPVSAADELAIWQSLFMVVPVISSTFASVARQFKNLGANSLGWIMIDEAGQAIPQAAVGALWRAKKAIVVGDPRQIEPIMTIPAHLIEGIAKHHFEHYSTKWMPHLTSIQKLADDASCYGSMVHINKQSEWVGTPLLVHRRCLNPMFEVANVIAYDNKMINVKREIEKKHARDNAWFDIQGTATDKQFVPEQGKFVLQFFIESFNSDAGLPKLFIITPFKQIRKNLKALLLRKELWEGGISQNLPRPMPKDISHWVHGHVGTVHTFQGKENEKVLLVLGADQKQKGAVRWASSKPNLLNVAITRATDRIYIVGDWSLWSIQPYFSDLAQFVQPVGQPI